MTQLMQLFVKHDRTYLVEVNSSNSVINLKKTITDKIGIPFDCFNLVYGSNYLKDEVKLSEYNITRDATLHLIIKACHTFDFDIDAIKYCDDTKYLIDQIEKYASLTINNCTVVLGNCDINFIKKMVKYYKETNQPAKMEKYYLIAGHYYKYTKQFDKMIKYYLKGSNNGNIDSTMELALYYKYTKQINKMKKYYVMGAKYYKDNNDIDNMINCYSILIDHGDVNSIKKLAKYYKDTEHYDEMIAYYLIGVDKGDIYSMKELAKYYKANNNIDMMVVYYLMAVDKGDKESTDELFKYYKETNQVNEMVKYMKSFDDIILDDTLKSILLNITTLPQSLKTSLINMFLMRKEMSFVYAMFKKYNITDSRISDLLQVLNNKMKLSIKEDCPICYNNTDLIIYECFGHYYCLDCIVSIDKCSICRIDPTQIKMNKKTYVIEVEDEDEDTNYSSDSD